ncbi:teichuronic acid biosynthesis protein TuaB [Litchfieldia alkalitelluris]|uniref:teichuronic acid biosynthesis protein TuaB n=1 Tax=Litchfieldia alkalitelluris TaxID=304268 RepID=UPI0009969705|nr:MOP flippase family protein [Litchfieldia alkalitelluris]
MSVIKLQMQKGIKWTGASAVLITIVQIAQFVMLGQSMSLAQFGQVGILTTIIIFAQIVIDLGLGSAVIQKQDVTNKTLSTLFWLNIFVGLVIFLTLFLTGPIISLFFQQPELTNVIRLVAVIFLIAPVGQQCQYLLQKHLRFDQLGGIEVSWTIISFIVLLVLLKLVSPIYAFAISQIAFYGGKGICYFLSYQKTWKPTFDFDLKESRELLAFGGYQLLSRLVNRIGSNLDVIIIGKFMGVEALGIYNLAYQIITIPVLKINPIITKVAFPLFSKNQQDHHQLTTGYLHMTKLLSIASFPILCGLISVTQEFVTLFFGRRWLVAVPVIQVMAIVGILRVLMNPNGSIILAKGKAKLAFYWDSGVLLFYGIALISAVTANNLVFVAWVYVIVSLVNFLLGRWLLTYLIQLKWVDYIKTIIIPLSFSIIISIGAFVVKEPLSLLFQGSNVLPFITTIFLSASVYILLFLLLGYFRNFVAIKRMLLKIRGRAI